MEIPQELRPHTLLQRAIERTDMTPDEIAELRLEFGLSLIAWAAEMAETLRCECEELADTPGFTDGEDDSPTAPVVLTAAQRARLGL